MIWKKKERKEEIMKTEIDSLKNNLKVVKKYNVRIMRTLNNLEKWFAQGKINYVTYQERKEKLSKLKTEYEVYIYRTKREIRKTYK